MVVKGEGMSRMTDRDDYFPQHSSESRRIGRGEVGRKGIRAKEREV